MEQVQKLITLPRYSFELRVERDEFLAQAYYQDFLENAGGDCEVEHLGGYQRPSLYIIGDHEERASTVTQLRKMSKTELVGLYSDVSGHWVDDDSYTKTELINNLRDLTMASYYKMLWGDGKYDVIPSIGVSGYTQGDYAEFVTIGDCERWVTEEYIQNLFYNCPLYARLNVVDNLTDEEEEVFLDEFLADEYEWSKESVLSGLGKIDAPWVEYAAEYCRENLEEYY